MKKYFFKLLTLLLFTSVAVSSCSVRYRENHRRHVHDNDHHDYRNY
jgi:hypothetical protein